VWFVRVYLGDGAWGVATEVPSTSWFTEKVEGKQYVTSARVFARACLCVCLCVWFVRVVCACGLCVWFVRVYLGDGAWGVATEALNFMVY
jgi:hypothetical protein